MGKTKKRRVRTGRKAPPLPPMGHFRSDCPAHPEKRVYRSQNQAERAAATRVADAALAPYQCPDCGFWHLTSRPRPAPAPAL